MESVQTKDSIQVEAGNWLLLQDAAKWAKWLAIAGFLFLGGLVYLGARSLYTLAIAPTKDPVLRELAATTSVVSLLSILFLYFPFRWLYRFGTTMKKAGRETAVTSLTISLMSLRAFFRYLAIWLFLLILLYVIFVAVAGFASLLNWGAH
ncbi:hypothetical protein [Flavihumibacter sp. CACIAM 22H1]|uniref:hypothetical protein n=1 Tax=Flavihumibacter sp. CACIAM 22H1 TaxID=1812911 RepID=UPI000AB2135B|nr:hypothetical protein [Flavihumibacter sp. CACIAM 22H1]